jgi:hypothetical protein
LQNRLDLAREAAPGEILEGDLDGWPDLTWRALICAIWTPTIVSDLSMKAIAGGSEATRAPLRNATLVTKPSGAVPDSPNTEVDLARIKPPGSIRTVSAIHAPGYGLFCCAERSCWWTRMESFGANRDQELRLLGPSPTASGSVPTPM